MSEYEFKVFMYESELKFLKWLVMQKPKIETGGDLFGLWQDKDTAVVQFILGPGQNCSRTTYSFHQDVEYLRIAGRYLITHEGLCNIGEWHSHHSIGLREPSGGDKDTVWKNLRFFGGQFLLFIANIQESNRGRLVEVRCFLFNSKSQRMSRGELIPLPSCNPLRHNPFNDAVDLVINRGSEQTQDWKTYAKSVTNYGSVSYRRSSHSGEYDVELKGSLCNVCRITEDDSDVSCCPSCFVTCCRACLKSGEHDVELKGSLCNVCRITEDDSDVSCCPCLRSCFVSCWACLKSCFRSCWACLRSCFVSCSHRLITLFRGQQGYNSSV